jgi:hypothetical protein
MNPARPKLGYSNVYWTKKITRRAKAFVEKQEEEELEEPVIVEAMSDRIKSLITSDTFCPPHLTNSTEQDKLFISPQQGVTNE